MTFAHSEPILESIAPTNHKYQNNHERLTKKH